MNPRLVIADDHELLRDVFAKYAEQIAGYQVIGSVADAQAAVNACRVLRPDVLLLDIEMPGRDSLSAIRDVRAASPQTKVVILTAHCRDGFIQLAIANGASGYLMKSEPAKEIFRAIERILSGEIVFSRIVQSRVQVVSQDHARAAQMGTSWLTPRELEVLRGIGQGLDNQQLASAMSISIRTVERHVSRLMDAVGIRDRARLVKYAYEHGLVA
jgi:DNA-binding NarL/FixJ family response regulator